jgi:hypothetical protein
MLATMQFDCQCFYHAASEEAGFLILVSRFYSLCLITYKEEKLASEASSNEKHQMKRLAILLAM